MIDTYGKRLRYGDWVLCRSRYSVNGYYIYGTINWIGSGHFYLHYYENGRYCDCAIDQRDYIKKLSRIEKRREQQMLLWRLEQSL